MAEKLGQDQDQAMKDILIGVTENCVSDTPDKVRNTLVNSIAANIFDTLKCNDDITQILGGVLDPSRTDKEVLMKNLMSKVNTTLQDSLLRTARGCSLNSDCLTPDNSDSMRSSTISSTSFSSGQTSNHEKGPRHYDGFETAESDFVYESSCSMETKKYEMGKHVEKHEVPLTVHELSKSISVPICVEDWVAANSGKMQTEKVQDNTSTTESLRSEEASRKVSTPNTMTSLESKAVTPVKVLPPISPKIVTSLPPLPRSHSATMFQERTAEKINESKSTQFMRNSELSGVSVMDPLEVKIKTAPKRQTPNFTTNPQVQYNGQESNEKQSQNSEKIPPPPPVRGEKDNRKVLEKHHMQSFQSNSSISVDAHIMNEKIMEKQDENKKSSKSILIQVQGQTPFLSNERENIPHSTCLSSNSGKTSQQNTSAHQIIEDAKNVPLPTIVVETKGNNEGHYTQDSSASNYESSDFRQEQRSDSRQSQRSLSPLSVGPIPSPIDPVQEEKAQETFDKLYEKMENNDKLAQDDGTQSTRHSSETITVERRTDTEIYETESRVHIVPISLVDKVDNIEDFKNIDMVTKYQEKISKETECLSPYEEQKQTTKQIKDKLEECKFEKEQTAVTESRLTDAQRTGSVWNELNPVHCVIPEYKLPPLEDPSIILLSPTPIKRSASFVHGSSQVTTSEEAHVNEEDFMELESLADDVKNIKEDKAASFLHEKLKDNIGDMVAYEKHNPEHDIDAEGKPLNHFGELKQKQKEAQKEFHKKLFDELQKEVGETKRSAVADALGTKFEVKVQSKQESHQQNNSKLCHSKSTNQIYETSEQQQGSLSVPSKSPEMSRRGSFSNTYMSKGAFWSHSLPRQKRRVTFDDETPARPPPPAPVRQQSIHTMKDFTNVTNVYNQVLEDRKHQILNPQVPQNEQVRTEAAAETVGAGLNNLQSVECRSYSKTRNMESSEKENEYKVDMGDRRDPWVELYGRSVLNNTLHDRVEQHKLQKSQSAVWSRAGSGNEIIEHAPVTSTDKLEKPKKVDMPTLIDNSPSINTLPRRSSPSMPAGSQQTNLRRNMSMSDLSGQSSLAAQYTNSDQSYDSCVKETLFQVPPSIVRGIVKTVLHNQGITNPSEEILNKAIQEYYSKNPQGVTVSSSQDNSGTQTQTVQPQKTFAESESFSEDFKRNVGNQPYRTSPLVTPTPRVNSAGMGYQHFRGPQYNTSPRQQGKSVPVYLRGASSLSNLHTADYAKPSEQAFSASAQSSPQPHARVGPGKPFLRQPDSFSNYRNTRSNSTASDSGGAYAMTKNNSINQSKSFKRVMADVLGPGETEF